MVGYLATSKKSGLRRCASRFGSRVLIVVASIVAFTVDLVTSASSKTTLPVVLPNSPRTFDTIMWRTTNPAAVCEESIDHSEAEAANGARRPRETAKAMILLDIGASLSNEAFVLLFS